MGKHLVWADIRCDLKTAEKCEEGIPCGWVANAKDIAEFIKQAKAAGWHTANGSTICPACAAESTKH